MTVSRQQGTHQFNKKVEETVEVSKRVVQSTKYQKKNQKSKDQKDF